MPVQNKALRIGVIAAAVVGTVAIPATAFAATSGAGLPSFAAATAAVQAQANHVVDIDGQVGPGRRGGEKADAGLTKLAASLNVSVDALKTAMKAAREETKPATPPTTKPDEATRTAHQDAYLASLAGKLGVSVDALKTALEANKPARPEGGPGKPGGHPAGHDHGNHLGTLATALGKTPAEVEAAMKAAREATKPATKPSTKPDEATRKAQQEAYLTAFAGKLGVSVDALKSATEASKPAAPAKPTTAEMKAMIQPRLAQMVTAKKLTQAQADQILADIDAGKPVFEILKQYMPQLGGGDHGTAPGGHGPGGRGPDAAGPRA